MGSNPGHAIPNALKMVLAAPLLALAYEGSICCLLCPKMAHELMLSVKNNKRREIRLFFLSLSIIRRNRST